MIKLRNTLLLATLLCSPGWGAGRIVNGEPALEGTAPWQVELYSTYVYTPAELAADAALPDGNQSKRYYADRAGWEVHHMCGGSYLGGNWILTAAHCVVLRHAGDDVRQLRRIRLGTQDLNHGGTTFRIERVVIHKDYDDEVHQHDLALIHVAADAATDRRAIALLRPVRLLGSKTSDPVLLPYKRVAVTGWGATSVREADASPLRGEDGQLIHDSPILMQAELTVLPQAKCEAIADFKGMLGGMICAGSSAAKVQDSCQGDSGGPLTLAIGPNERVLIGVVSWGMGCGLAGMPGLYTDVTTADVRRWIAQAKHAPPGQISRR